MDLDDDLFGEKMTEKKPKIVKKSSKLVSDILDGVRRTQKKETAISGADLETRYQLGVEAPLAFQYMLGVNIFPLGILLQLRGPEDSKKTSLGLEFCRWAIENNGIAIWIDGEKKFPYDIGKSLLGEDIVRDSQLFKYHQTGRAAEAQDIIRDYINGITELNQTIRDAKEKDNPKGKTSEYAQMEESCGIIVLDSLGALLSDQEREKIKKEGFGGRSVAPYAHAWRQALSAIADDLAQTKITLIVINHERQNISPYGGGLTTPGGSQLEYLKSVDIRTKEDKAKSDSGEIVKDVTTKILTLQCKKNMGGPPGREIPQLKFSWDLQRNFQFDWGFALGYVLKSWLSVNKDHKIGPIESLSMWRQNFSCDDPEFQNEPGEYIEELIRTTPELYNDFHRRLGIAKRPTITKPETDSEGEASEEVDSSEGPEEESDT